MNKNKLRDAAPDLLKGLTAMLLVYPAGGRGDAEDREAAVTKAISAYEKATGEKWTCSGSLQKTQAKIKELLSQND
jgi:hypothetical protein